MKFSDDRLSHLARLILTDLMKGGVVNTSLESQALHEIKKTFIDYLKVEEAADQMVRDKISKLKRVVEEGSREWDVLYRKYLEEELAKRGH